MVYFIDIAPGFAGLTSQLVGTLLGNTARNNFIMVVCRIFVSLVLNSYTEGACYRQ